MAYHGNHHFNRIDTCNGRPRPPSEWIEFSVSAIVEEETFNTVHALLQSRSPKRAAPKIVNGSPLLAGIARYSYCETGFVLNTGKGRACR